VGIPCGVMGIEIFEDKGVRKSGEVMGKRCKVVVVVLPDPFLGMEAWRNSTETQQSSHAPRSGPEVKNETSSAKDGEPERLGCGTVKEKVSHILHRVSASAA